jgi:mercuric ion binding protein
MISAQALAGERAVRLAVDNMDCAACPLIVKQSLAKVPGVTKVEVSYARKTAPVTFDDAKATVAALIEATAKAGYPSRVQE